MNPPKKGDRNPPTAEYQRFDDLKAALFYMLHKPRSNMPLVPRGKRIPAPPVKDPAPAGGDKAPAPAVRASPAASSKSPAKPSPAAVADRKDSVKSSAGAQYNPADVTEGAFDFVSKPLYVILTSDCSPSESRIGPAYRGDPIPSSHHLAAPLHGAGGGRVCSGPAPHLLGSAR